MRILYNLLTYLLFIPYAGYWLFRAVVNPVYRAKIGQRFGAGYPKLRPVKAERYPGHRVPPRAPCRRARIRPES